MKGAERLGFTVLALIAAIHAAAQAPVPVVERITTRLDRTIRVALFSNHVAVVTIRSPSEDFFHRATLDYDEYMVYLQTIEGLAETIGDHPVSSDVSSGDDSTVLIIHVGGPEPRRIEYSPLASLNLSAARIAAIADDIETRVLETLPGEHEIRHWQPEVGDCVELRLGGEACVAEVGDDGTVVLVERSTSVEITVFPETRVQVIADLIDRSP
jgi:hypothetical protein